jgi:rhodanese-related sulfurtransferase
LKGQHGKSIALICATGGRTGYVVSLLSKDGFKGVIDVSEGMVGNERGPGWIARGLPLVSANEAKEAYQKLILSR